MNTLFFPNRYARGDGGEAEGAEKVLLLAGDGTQLVVASDRERTRQPYRRFEAIKEHRHHSPRLYYETANNLYLEEADTDGWNSEHHRHYHHHHHFPSQTQRIILTNNADDNDHGLYQNHRHHSHQHHHQVQRINSSQLLPTARYLRTNLRIINEEHDQKDAEDDEEWPHQSRIALFKDPLLHMSPYPDRLHHRHRHRNTNPNTASTRLSRPEGLQPHNKQKQFCVCCSGSSTGNNDDSNDNDIDDDDVWLCRKHLHQHQYIVPPLPSTEDHDGGGGGGGRSVNPPRRKKVIPSYGGGTNTNLSQDDPLWDVVARAHAFGLVDTPAGSRWSSTECGSEWRREEDYGAGLEGNHRYVRW